VGPDHQFGQEVEVVRWLQLPGNSFKRFDDALLTGDALCARTP
jgi:hypothetical protein